MEELNMFDMSIPQEEFEFAKDNKLTDKKFDTKPIGFFKDALIRFRKNKGSVVAFFIIVLIVLYALIVPFVVPSHMATMPDSYYKYMSPRNTFMKEHFGVMGGFRDKDISESALYLEYAKAVAADGYDGKIETVAESKNSYYQPIYKITGTKTVSNGKTENTIYDVKVDTYLSVGFIYRTVTPEEYDSLVAWEKETGLHVLYPLVDILSFSVGINISLGLFYLIPFRKVNMS